MAELSQRLGADGADAEIHWAVQPEFSALVRAFACVTKVIEVPRPSRLRDYIRALRALRRERYDLVIDLQGLLKSALIARFARLGAPTSPSAPAQKATPPHPPPARIASADEDVGAPTLPPRVRRVGPSFAREGSRLFYDALAGTLNKNRHAVDECMDILDFLKLGRPAAPIFPLTLPPSAAPASATTSPRIALAPFSRWDSKNWPESHFARLINILTEKRAAQIFIIGGKGDATAAEKIIELARTAAIPVPWQSPDPATKTEIINCAGKLSILESAALLKSCDCLITNDSGPMHIAAALGIPCVVPFGPTNPLRTGPYGANHKILRAPEGTCELAPCRKKICPKGTKACMSAITPEAALHLILRNFLVKSSH